MKRTVLITVLITVMLCVNPAYAEENLKILTFTDSSLAETINDSELTEHAVSVIEDETLKITLSKGAEDPHFMLPVSDLNAESGKDNILAVCLKTTFRTFENDYAFITFETTSGTGTISANSYAVSEKWQVIYFRLGSSENYKGTLKSIRFDPFAKAPENEEDCLYQIKWISFFENINAAKDYSEAYLNTVNPSPVPGETEKPHLTETPKVTPEKDNTIWRFIWTIVGMLLITVVLTYFIERQRRIETAKQKVGKKHKNKKR